MELKTDLILLESGKVFSRWGAEQPPPCKTGTGTAGSPVAAFSRRGRTVPGATFSRRGITAWAYTAKARKVAVLSVRKWLLFLYVC